MNNTDENIDKDSVLVVDDEPEILGLLFDALSMRFRELKLPRDPACPVCGENPTVTELIDYHEFCGIGPEEVARLGDELEISPTDLKARLDRGDRLVLLDVRNPPELEICRLDGATLIPLPELPGRVHELDSADEIVAYCRVGERSAHAVAFLRRAGFRKVKNLTGGTNAWSRSVDGSIPVY